MCRVENDERWKNEEKEERMDWKQRNDDDVSGGKKI